MNSRRYQNPWSNPHSWNEWWWRTRDGYHLSHPLRAGLRSVLRVNGCRLPSDDGKVSHGFSCDQNVLGPRFACGVSQSSHIIPHPPADRRASKSGELNPILGLGVVHATPRQNRFKRKRGKENRIVKNYVWIRLNCTQHLAQ